ncbi:MAG: DUF4160 domain-containing protein [Bacteroidales bacterium]|nr:DUF4160 domain-containing protein [Bacteroidales bacterium]
MDDDYRFMQRTTPKEIIQFLHDVFAIYEIRGCVGSVKGIKFIVHSIEQNHVIPHVHAEYGKYHISIAIKDQKILAGNLPPKQQKIAQEWVKEHQQDLLSKWSEMALSAKSSMTQSQLDWTE